jgi:hypothetical protein
LYLNCVHFLFPYSKIILLSGNFSLIPIAHKLKYPSFRASVEKHFIKYFVSSQRIIFVAGENR